MTAPSDIRVFVEWVEQTIFAGEDIECQITFKNIAPVPSSRRPSPRTSNSNGFEPPGERQKKAIPPPAPSASFKSNSIQNPRGAPPSTRGHRSTTSLGVPSINSRSQREPGSERASHSRTNAAGYQHQRSLSIISVAASEDTINGTTSEAGERPRRPARGHGRAASLQILPGRSVDVGPLTAPMIRPTTSFSPGINSPAISPRFPENFSARRNTGPISAPNTPGRNHLPRQGSRNSPMTPQTFKFPSLGESQSWESGNSGLGITSPRDLGGMISPRTGADIPVIFEQSAPRILTPSSNAETPILGTPRSSGDFYSLSNNSAETLVSEYSAQQSGRKFPRPPHVRKPSNLGPSNHQRPPETLMMGYAQVSGNFTVDGSLINQAPFEEVKRKGVVGGQGGGVVGLDTGKRDSSLLGAFGWANFGQSLGGLLGGNELSSIKDMRGVASSRSIPLLSTPQSILFIDLKLAPGESKSYKYSFKLPKGLPPSHRGKAIKVSYQLVISTQRPPLNGAREQQVKSVEIPFRLLGSVNDHGELLGHDLMSPYIFLKDEARVQSLEHIHSSLKAPNKPSQLKESSLDDFIIYVDELLNRSQADPSMGLLSPTAMPLTRRPSSVSIFEPTTAKEAIDMAILRSNITSKNQQSANRFEIARNGRRIAVIRLARPAWRIGETITCAIDFNDADIPCYALHASLESSETVDAAIALRSSASIHRVTRKIHASMNESALFSHRVVFSPTVPMVATPAFITSGVCLEWKIRIEFVTPSSGNPPEVLKGGLLEVLGRDGRGVILGGVQHLGCESFEIAVPILVYGAQVGAQVEKGEGDKEGLVV